MQKVRTQGFRPQRPGFKWAPAAAVLAAALVLMGSAGPGGPTPSRSGLPEPALPVEAWRYIPPPAYAVWVYSYCAETGLAVDEACRVIWHESRWDPEAVNTNGGGKGQDVGLFQLNSNSLAYFAKQYNDSVKIDPTDSKTNLRVGIRHLADLRRRFGSLAPALAAWNAGPARALSPPASTRAFVRAILAP